MGAQPQHIKNYLKDKQRQQGQQNPGAGKHTNFQRSAPDNVIHLPPAFHFLFGGLGVLGGLLTNLWQGYTTFIAMWFIMDPNGQRIDHANQPAKFAVAAVIAFGAQLGLLMLTFKIDSTWKRRQTGSQQNQGGAAKGYAAAAVEVVQHIDLVSAWGAISFVIDTIGDFTFVSGILGSLDIVSQVFITALYAIFLYALSTVAFARSVEYVWAGLAATARYVLSQQGHRKH